jgi:hypothetical protein
MKVAKVLFNQSSVNSVKGFCLSNLAIIKDFSTEKPDD